MFDKEPVARHRNDFAISCRITDKQPELTMSRDSYNQPQIFNDRLKSLSDLVQTTDQANDANDANDGKDGGQKVKSDLQNLLAQTSTFQSVLNEVLSSATEAGKKASLELQEQTPDLKSMYSYCGITGDLNDVQNVIDKLTDTVDRFDCDIDDYTRSMEHRFILCLAGHPDPRLAMMAAFLCGLRRQLNGESSKRRLDCESSDDMENENPVEEVAENIAQSDNPMQEEDAGADQLNNHQAHSPAEQTTEE